MCGIAAALPGDEAFLRHVVAEQGVRGPDQEAVVDLGFCGLGINRLAISGLQGGDQPLVSDDGSVVVVFNGAIYNAARLVEAYDLHPRSTNDGEVIPALYQRFGLGFADHLEGMFAICLADLRTRRLVVAVDQLGIKPMYVCEQGPHRYVASTITAFPAGLRGGVRRMPPGVVWSSAGEIRHIVHRVTTEGSLESLLRASVAEQIPEEVPWGCLLSGGVDSSVVARLAAEHGGPVATFTLGHPASSDLAAAREVAAAIGADHHEVIIDPDELPAVVDAAVRDTASMERWTVMTAVGTSIAAGLARRHGVKVLLSGEGADELFGGYAELQEVPAAYLNTTLMQYQANLGVTECLRLDRATMAHSIEARVPFLSTSLMRHARALGPDDKICFDGGRATTKVALRRFARTVLPVHLAERTKEELARGSGLVAELERIAPEHCPPIEVSALHAEHPSFPVTDPLSGWFLSRWLDIFGTSIGTQWDDLVHRGLFRQRPSIYLPGVEDAARYA